MNMFLARLTGSNIGITAGAMFVIDKNTVLTVSLYYTYFILWPINQLWEDRSSLSVFLECTIIKVLFVFYLW